MTEAEWLSWTDPFDLLVPPAVLARRRSRRGSPHECNPLLNDDRKLRLFACGCFRLTFPRLRFDADRAVLAAAERFADGECSAAELYAASRRCGMTASALGKVPAIEAATGVARGWAWRADHPAGSQVMLSAETRCAVLRDVFGSPFHPVAVNPEWLNSTVLGLAEGIYADRAFDRLPILADALEDAGCDNHDILAHCRGDGPHVRGCWVVDLVLGKV